MEPDDYDHSAGVSNEEWEDHYAMRDENGDKMYGDDGEVIIDSGKDPINDY